MRARGIDELERAFDDAVDVGPRDRALGAAARARRGRVGRRLRRRGGPGSTSPCATSACWRAARVRALDARRERPAGGLGGAARPRGGRARAAGGARRPAAAPAVREPALRAAGRATHVLEQHRQPVGQRDRRPDPLDRRRPAARHRDGLRRGRATPCVSAASRGRRPRSPADRRSSGWQAGHQYVVRPPIVARASAVPQRGQLPPRRRWGMSSPVCTPPVADRVARRGAQRAAQAVELLVGRARPPAAAARAARATASRRRAGCRRR